MIKKLLPLILILAIFVGCSDDDDPTGPQVLDPDTAPKATVDRFSDDAANLMKRSDNPSLPAAGEAIDFDMAPFITKGLGPNGEMVEYYNFDVMSTTTAPIYAFFYESSKEAVPNQLNIVGVKPGDAGYNDFWHVHQVLVPDDYTANSITNVDDLMAMDYTIESTNVIKNCPIVPDGSTASKRLGDEPTGLVRGWYKDMVVYYFLFEEKELTSDVIDMNSNAIVPLSHIYVTFNSNGDPSSGFVTEDGTDQTHNVIETIPSDDDYSPLWHVDVYDNADFDQVNDLNSAMNATILEEGKANVNCPVVVVN